ncbi:MAG TPA: hypothetical protein PLE43_09835 [Alphaproteobacteria bacterium]|nr:hypothetical protein [Alphaproteobacteria bacterium]
MTHENVFSFDSLPQIEKLKSLLCGIDECKRLGFIYIDEQGIQSLSTAGMAYLLYVVGKDITSLAEAFALGRMTALDEVEDLKS